MLGNVGHRSAYITALLKWNANFMLMGKICIPLIYMQLFMRVFQVQYIFCTYTKHTPRQLPLNKRQEMCAFIYSYIDHFEPELTVAASHS